MQLLAKMTPDQVTKMPPSISFAGQKLFFPISIGNHFYSKKVFKFIIKELAVDCESAVIFICDRLRYLYHQAMGYGTPEETWAHVDEEFEQIKRTLVNCGLNENPKIELWRWQNIEQKENYQRILEYLTQAANDRKPNQIRSFLEPFTRELTEKFYGENFSTEQLEIQQEYILIESALSIYITEIAGFNVELYKNMDRGLIVELYHDNASFVKKMIGKDALDRQFFSLMELLSVDTH
jgi:tRNA-dependent cyclodipeptide synthase